MLHPPVGREVASLDRKCLGAERPGRSWNADRRDIFDKETRRKALAFAADAAPMGFQWQAADNAWIAQSRTPVQDTVLPCEPSRPMLPPAVGRNKHLEASTFGPVRTPRVASAALAASFKSPFRTSGRRRDWGPVPRGRDARYTAEWLGEMELSLDSCTKGCPHCGKVNLFVGFLKMLAYICRECGEPVKLSDDPEIDRSFGPAA